MSAKNRSTCVLVVKKISVNHSPYHVDVTVESPTETKVEVSLGLRLCDLARRSESGLEELGKGDGSVVPPSCD